MSTVGPRLNSSGIETSPPVGLIFPELNRSEWSKFRAFMPNDRSLGNGFEGWLAEREVAILEGTLLQPMVPMSITHEDWVASLEGATPPRYFKPVRDYAIKLYQKAITQVIDEAENIEKARVIPSKFVLAVTELIGQDQANDVSHIFLIEPGLGEESRVTTLVRNARIIFQHAGTLGASYAVKLGVTSLRWKMDKTYAWS